MTNEGKKAQLKKQMSAAVFAAPPPRLASTKADYVEGCLHHDYTIVRGYAGNLSAFEGRADRSNKYVKIRNVRNFSLIV